MKFYFIDDSKQRSPSRSKLGPLCAIGGVVLDSEKVQTTETSLEKLCKDTGFGENDIFKWSPHKGQWMRDNLKGESRTKFQTDVIKILKESEAQFFFVCVDEDCQKAVTKSKNSEEDTINLLLERIDWHLQKTNSYGLMVMDRPGGDKKDEENFLLECLETIRVGTEWRIPDRLVMSPLSSPSIMSRLLQAADMVVSCTLARVSGENQYSLPVFDEIQSSFIKEAGRIGGVGAKLHPKMKFVNLYHWIFGDTAYKHSLNSKPLPIVEYAFARNENEY